MRSLDRSGLLHGLHLRLEKAVFSKNAVLVQALSITPIVAVAYNLKTAIALGAVTAALLIPLEFFASLLLKKTPAWLRAALYMAYGTGMVALLTPLITSAYKGVGITLGVYLPLMAVNSLLFSRCESYAVRQTVKNSLLDGVTVTLGVTVILILTGVLREFLGNATLYGIPVGIPKIIPAAVYPFGGLILLGFFAALFQAHALRGTDSAEEKEESPHD